MKKFFAVSISLILMLSAVGCGKSQNADKQNLNNQDLTYSNLAGDASRSEVTDILESNGLNKQAIETVMTWADDFNSNSQGYEFKEGFQPLPETGMDYSSLMLDDTSEAYSYLQWLNCRLTAFSLLKDQIKTAKTGFDTDPWLMFDIEAIDTVQELHLNEDERANFITLFNQISVEGTSTLEEHEKKIKEAWEERKIEISTDTVSLICIYLHSPEDNVRFVGHAGVLSETDNGLLFIEKYSSLDPFQATYFQDKESLKQYLLSRSDLYGDTTELDPIITENGDII